MFNKVENVFEHFTLNHKDMEYPTLDKCNMKCNQQGCFKGPFETFDDLLEHSEREHNFYVKNLLKKLQMELTLIPLPMKNSQSVMNNENVTAKEKKEMQEIPYRRLIGMVLHLANCTRRDISAAVGILATCDATPGRKDPGAETPGVRGEASCCCGSACTRWPPAACGWARSLAIP